MSPLQSFIEQQRQNKPILLMTHVIYGYPTVADSLQLMADILATGVEILEVQFPFSDPVADGPAITAACHTALEQKPELGQCLVDLAKLQTLYPDSRILLMSYLNPLVQYGFDRLIATSRGVLSGFIIPDLPIQMGRKFAADCAEAGMSMIWLTTPDIADERLQEVAQAGHGMLYCVSRRGVTGGHTTQDDGLASYLTRVRQQVSVPLGVGFGIQDAEDVAALNSLADIAILGSALLRAYNESGSRAVTELVRSLR